MWNWKKHSEALVRMIRVSQAFYSLRPGPTPRRVAPFLAFLRRMTPPVDLMQPSYIAADLDAWKKRLAWFEMRTSEVEDKDSLPASYLRDVAMPLIWGAYEDPSGSITRKPPESVVPLTLSIQVGIHEEAAESAWAKLGEDLNDPDVRGEYWSEKTTEAIEAIASPIAGLVAIAAGVAGAVWVAKRGGK